MDHPFNDKKHIELRTKLHLPDDKIKFTKAENYSCVRIASFDRKCYQPNYNKLKLNEKPIEYYTERLTKSIKKINDNKDLSKKDKKTKILCLSTKSKKKMNNLNKIMRSYKYKLELTTNQQKILFKWFDICNYVYNRCVYYFNNDSNSFMSMSKSNFFNKIFSDGDKLVPYDILTGEFMNFKANAKSAFSNLKNGTQKHFEMKYKNMKVGRTILIPVRGINKNGFYCGIMGKIKHFDKIINVSDIAGDCKLNYDKLTNNWYFIKSQYIERKIVTNKKKVAAVDEGESVFVTFYSPTECGKIGENLRKPILKIQSDIKHLQSTIRNGKNKDGNKIKNKKKLKKKIGRKYRKINHIVDEVHHQAANYLCQNYERILVPTFETKKMVLKNDGKTRTEKKRKNKLNKRVKFVLMMQAHFKFKQYLKSKAEEYGSQIIDCNESYTSQCCGKCGHLSSDYTRRIKRCPECEHKINRDINGARNVFIKNYKFTIKK